jgi:UDP-N-acetylmuramoyl-tripeptide--D-alanyl-D-alanine ligase
VPGGTAIIKYDNPHADRLTAIAERCGARAVTFGFGANADVRGDDLKLDHDGSALTVRFGERRVPLQLAMPGRHIAENALAVAAAIHAVGADVEKALSVLADLQPPSGRGARSVLHIGGGEALLIDESYNANPASMRAALATLASVPRQKFSRRIAVLGDMLELGADAPALHEGLKDAVEEAGIDLIFACGPHMKGLYDALPKSKKGGYASTSSSLQGTLLSNLRRGDVIMVKASNGTRLGSVVAALKAQFGIGGPVS